MYPERRKIPSRSYDLGERVRQGSLRSEEGNSVSGSSSEEEEDEDNDNDICVRKVMMVEEIVYDEVVQCKHTLRESCYESYKTVFKTQEVRS